MLARSNIWYDSHVATTLSNRSSAIGQRDGRDESASSPVVRAGRHSVERSKRNAVRRKEKRLHTQRTASVQRICSDRANRNEHVCKGSPGKALIDFGVTRSMGSWEALDGLARMNEQHHGSSSFMLGLGKENIVHLRK